MGRRNRVLMTGALIVLGLALGACASLAPDSGAGVPASAVPDLKPTSDSATELPTPALTPVFDPSPQHEEEVTVPMTPTVSMPAGAGLESLVLQAVADLAQRLAVDEDQIELVEAKSVVWPDGGLGCPQAGMAYIQVQQDGALIRLAAGGRTYNYHSGGGRDPFPCEQPAAQPPSKGASEDAPGTPPARRQLQPSLTEVPLQPVEVITISKPLSPTIPPPASPGLAGLVEQATADLAQRLSVDLDRIDLVEAKAVVWPDGGLGCPQPGMAYTQVRRDGALIRLRAGKRLYNYHSGGGRPPFLCEQAEREEGP